MSMLNQHTIHIWHTRFEEHTKKNKLFQSWLTAEEKIRAGRLAESFRQRFIISRAVLRDILAYYSRQCPKKLKLTYSVYGKPLLINSDHLEFNLSHSKNILVYVFTLETPVGIDIEHIKQRNHLNKIAYRFLPAYEFDRLQLLEHKIKLKEFFEAWVRNEALIKAKGDILKTHQHSQYELTLSSQLNFTECIEEEINSFYTISNLSLYHDFATAIAIKGNEKHFIINKYTERLSGLNN